MILRKPYAFLIKNFKIIHLILSFFLVYIIYKSSKIFTFFNSYAKNGYYSYYENINKAFLNPLLYICILFVLILSFILFFVMRWKDKKRKYYLFLILFYVALLGVFLYTNIVFNEIASSTLDIKTIRSYRDIWLIIYGFQFITITMSVIRGLGFNIKSFNFKKDLEDLQITDKDSEEFELKAGSNTYKYKRDFRKYFREFKYYLVENKKILILIITILLLTLFVCLGLFYNNKSKIYNDTNIFSDNDLSYKINNIYVTSLDYNGNNISNTKVYLIIAFNVKNNSDNNKSVIASNFIVKDNNKTYHSLTSDKNFIDLGKLYNVQIIKPNAQEDYIFIYELPKDININEVETLYSYNKTIKEKTDVYYYRFNIDKENLDTEIVKEVYNLKQNITMENITLSINDIKVQESFVEKSKVIINDKEYSNTYYIKPDLNNINKYDILRLDISCLESEKDLKDFFETYGLLKYSINDTNKSIKFLLLKYSNNYLYFYIPKKAKNIELVFTIRNRSYIIK